MLENCNDKADSFDLKKTFLYNCLSHVMCAEEIMVTKHYKKHKKEAMYWISVLFNCSTFEELENVIKT